MRYYVIVIYNAGCNLMMGLNVNSDLHFQFQLYFSYYYIWNFLLVKFRFFDFQIQFLVSDILPIFVETIMRFKIIDFSLN